MLFNNTRNNLFYTLVLGAATCQTSRGGGFDLPDLDAFSVGRGMAVVATADNPSAIYFNPAGITQLEGDNVRAGLYGIYLDPSYQRPGSSTTYDNEATLHAVPQLYYTHSFSDYPITLGLGIYTPFGLGTKWPQDAGFRAVGTEASVADYTINPVIAVKLPWHLSLAAGLMVDYASVDLEQGLTPVPNADLFRFQGDAWGLGYNLGAKWDPLKQLSFGVSFRGPTRMSLTGRTDTESLISTPAVPLTPDGASLTLPLPLEVVTGVSYRPTEKWNFEFDAQYTDWNALGTLTIHQVGPNAVVPLSNVPVAFDWTSSWYFEWGATRYFDNGWHVSAGYIFNESSIPDSHFSPLVTDLDKHFFSLGTGYKGKHLSFDVAYQLGYGPDHTVVGSAAPLGYPAAYHPADGTYGYISHAISLSAGWHF